MRISINAKALGAFKKLGAVALITATIFFVACNQTGGGGGKPKHAVTFSVEGSNGTLKAKADGVDETSTSPINVEEGKTVTFTAEPSANYKVKEWKVGDTIVTGNKTNTYTHTVTQATTVSVSFELSPVEGGAVLILNPDKLNIKVKARTKDGSDITVEGCTVATLASGTTTTLTATGTRVVLKGEITELDCYSMPGNSQPLTALNVSGLTSLRELSCSGNQLTALNVQGCTALQGLSCGGNKLTELNVQGLTALQELWCSNNQLPELNVQGCVSLQKLSCEGNKLTELNVQGCVALKQFACFCNKLNAQAMTELLNALPAREESDNAMAILYSEGTGFPEGNHKDFTQPAELKTALDGAKKKNWKLLKINESGSPEDI